MRMELLILIFVRAKSENNFKLYVETLKELYIKPLSIKVAFGIQVSIQSKMFLHLKAGAGQRMRIG